MNQYRYIVILLITALPLSLAGCAEVQTGNNILTEAQSSETQNTMEPSTEAEEQINHAPIVDITDVREEDIEEGSYWQYIVDKDGICLVISPKATVYAFTFVGVEAGWTEAGPEYSIIEEQYTVEELTPDRPFLVKMLFVGMMPTYGVVFEDEHGCERLYTINAKGTGPEESYPYFLQEIEHWKRT